MDIDIDRSTEESSVSTTHPSPQALSTGAYADVNGLHLYYQVHGTGRPLVLLHGGLMSNETFGSVIPALVAAGHQVVAPDLQGHGRTADIDRPIDTRLMAGDIVALIEQLGLDQPDLIGYSLGGGVALQVALQRPELLRRLVLVSTNIRRDAIPPEMLAQQLQVNAAAVPFMKETPMWELYQRVAPRPEDFGRLLDKLGAFMSNDFDLSDEVSRLQVPTLLVAADADMAPPSHYVEAFRLLDGGLRDGGWMGEGRPKGGHALAILPGLTHYDIGDSPLLATAALSFLDGPTGGARDS